MLSSSTEQEGEISTPNVQKLSSDLRPLMFWMSNATELLNFFQVKVEVMEKEWEFEGENNWKTTEGRGGGPLEDQTYKLAQEFGKAKQRNQS